MFLISPCCSCFFLTRLLLFVAFTRSKSHRPELSITRGSTTPPSCREQGGVGTPPPPQLPCYCCSRCCSSFFLCLCLVSSVLYCALNITPHKFPKAGGGHGGEGAAPPPQRTQEEQRSGFDPFRFASFPLCLVIVVLVVVLPSSSCSCVWCRLSCIVP